MSTLVAWVSNQHTKACGASFIWRFAVGVRGDVRPRRAWRGRPGSALRSGSAGTGAVAGLHESDETPLERLQFAHFRSNCGEVFRRHIARVHTGALGIVHDRNQRTNLFDREVELPTTTDERQALHIVAAVHALPTGLPKSAPHQPDLFVVPNRRNRRARPLRQLADLDFAHKTFGVPALEPQAHLRVYIAIRRSTNEGSCTNGQSWRAPIACTLQPRSYQERLAWLARLARDGLLGMSRDDLRLELRYAPGVADQVREMVAKEQACCAFLNFELSESGEDVRLTITAPERARDVADALFEQFVAAGVAPTSKSAPQRRSTRRTR